MLCERALEYKKLFTNDGRMVVELDKAVYECIESVKLWYQQFEGSLE